MKNYGLNPADVSPWVDALGKDKALALFLSLGGAPLHLSARMGPASTAMAEIGPDNVARLLAELGPGNHSIPLARKWCAHAMLEKGFSKPEIARAIGRDVATVRQWLSGQDADQVAHSPLASLKPVSDHDSDPQPAAFPTPPANIEPYVEALGVDGAIALFLSVGGTDIYLPEKSSPRSLAARTIGAAQVEKLARILGHGYIKVPVGNRWTAEVMRARGIANAEIARTLRVDVATVRRWLPAKDGTSQMDLFSKSA